MLNITRCFQDVRLFKAVTGMTSAEFEALLPAFTGALAEHKENTKPTRRRQEGGGRKHTLITGREKLFFIVVYVKCYATFDVLGWMFEVDPWDGKRSSRSGRFRVWRNFCAVFLR